MEPMRYSRYQEPNWSDATYVYLLHLVSSWEKA